MSKKEELFNAADCVPSEVDDAESECEIGEAAAAEDGSDEFAEAEAVTVGSARLDTAHVAHRLIEEHGDEFRFLVDRAAVFAFKNGIWQADSGDKHNLTHMLFRVAHELSLQIYDESSAPAHVKTHLLSAKFPKAVAGMTAALLEHCKFADRFDVNPDVIGLPDGRLCELRTGVLRDAVPRDYISKTTAVLPDVTQTPERFLQFLDEITCGDAELKNYLLRLLGYCCTGHMTEEYFGLWTGTGANGKSVLCDTATATLGDYTAILSVKLLAAGPGQDSEQELRTMAQLCGARIAFASESSKTLKLDNGLTKKLAAPEKLLGRFLYENAFSFHPSHKIVVSAQELSFEKLDYAIERRLHVVEFRQKFCRPETIADYPGALPIDKAIWPKLHAERAGILALLLREAREWYSNGLLMPKSVVDSRARYIAEHDNFGSWLNECFRDPAAFTPSQELHAGYVAAMNALGIEEILKIGPFVKMLVSRGFKTDERRTERGKARGIVGLRLRAIEHGRIRDDH
jgi:P4 family phage/plasmid primase-like protien